MFPAPSMSVEDADRWADAAPTGWHRWAILAAWLTGVVVEVSAPANCTPDDPSVCGPDSMSSLALVLLIGSTALLWWRPILACVCGVTFGVLEVLFDPVDMMRVVFGVCAVLCAVCGSRVVASRRRQVAISREAVEGYALSVDEARPVPRPDPSFTGGVSPTRSQPRVASSVVLTAVGLAVLAGIALLAYVRATGTEQQHANRAVSARARVISTTDGYGTIARVEEPANLAGDYHIDLLTSRPLGSELLLLLDPLDRKWVRAVAEPADLTYWLTLSGCAAGLAALLVLGQAEASRARPKAEPWQAPRRCVRVVRRSGPGSVVERARRSSARGEVEDGRRAGAGQHWNRCRLW